MRAPKEIKTTGIYVETNRSADDIVQFIKWMLDEYGISYDDLVFYIEEKNGDPAPLSEDIDFSDPTSFNGKKIGTLAFLLIQHLLVNEKINNDEIVNLQDKAFSHTLFSALHYPVLSTERDAYSNGGTKRYYKDGITMRGTTYFISSQWFEEDRDKLIAWYLNH